MGELLIGLAAGLGAGWFGRGVLDRAVTSITIRAVVSAVGREKVGAALAKIAAEEVAK